jgi:hypothetical protein
MGQETLKVLPLGWWHLLVIAILWPYLVLGRFPGETRDPELEAWWFPPFVMRSLVLEARGRTSGIHFLCFVARRETINKCRANLVAES